MIRRALPGTGDAYHWRGGHTVTIGAIPVGLVSVAPTKVSAPPRSSSSMVTFVVDPGLEKERAAIGSVIVGDCTVEETTGAVRCPRHLAILDALAGEYVGSVQVAIQLCRTAGLPPELVGRVDGGHAFGYLAGCVRSWRASAAMGGV